MNTETLYQKGQVVIDRKTGKRMRILEIYPTKTPERTVYYEVRKCGCGGGCMKFVRRHDELAPYNNPNTSPE